MGKKTKMGWGAVFERVFFSLLRRLLCVKEAEILCRDLNGVKGSGEEC